MAPSHASHRDYEVPLRASMRSCGFHVAGFTCWERSGEGRVRMSSIIVRCELVQEDLFSPRPCKIGNLLTQLLSNIITLYKRYSVHVHYLVGFTSSPAATQFTRSCPAR